MFARHKCILEAWLLIIASRSKKKRTTAKGGDYYHYYYYYYCYHYSRKEEVERGAQPNSSAKINRVRGWRKKKREKSGERIFGTCRVTRYQSAKSQLIWQRITVFPMLHAFSQILHRIKRAVEEKEKSEESRYFCLGPSPFPPPPLPRTKVDRERLKIEFKEWRQSFLTFGRSRQIEYSNYESIDTGDRTGNEANFPLPLFHFFSVSIDSFFEFGLPNCVSVSKAEN